MADPKDPKDDSEEDVHDDDKVAASRADGSAEDEGSYVGRTASDDSLDTEESGAEARAERG
ncbi:hypothetical protein BH11ACT7_BH11ACT7_10410 [soil metagenome]